MPKDDWLKLAILYDKTAKYSPSNQEAIEKFRESATKHDMQADIISKDDIDILGDYDGLLIRDTTNIDNYAYEFAIAAEMKGLKVIDSSASIMIGCNKIWQASMFDFYKIPHPKTWVINPSIGFGYTSDITFPAVLKISNSCFSKGVYLVRDRVEFEYHTHRLLEKSLICQEFIETTFDWRITIFNHKFLFAIKYYMVSDDWKIIKYNRSGEYIDGNHECVSFENIPSNILTTIDQCKPFLTNGLYGIDIKEINGNVYVIEINDNPNIDAGVEDEIEGENIYDTITSWYKNPIHL